jgi:hypothetical protein
MNMHHGRSVQRLKEGQFYAEVQVNFEYLGPDWDYVVGPDDLSKIERVREALKSGDVVTASREAKVFKLHPVAAE